MLTIEQDFIDNIGNRIFREKSTCKCNSCQDVEENWIIIYNKEHAEYLYMVYCSYMSEWKNLKYRLTK